MMIIVKNFLFLFVSYILLISANLPLGNDKRIITYVYNPNQVYLIKTEFNFQSSIEFSEKEEVKTVALGDSYVWRVTPMGRTMFINPQMRSGRTNMTVVTNLRKYYFDLVVSEAEELENYIPMYVVKFYYPKD